MTKTAIKKRGDKLIVAAQNRQLDVVNRLLKLSKSVNLQNKIGNTALIQAAMYGYSGIVNRLLDCKQIDVNVKNRVGWTALIYAAMYGHSDIVNRLLDCKNIDVNFQDKYENTALIYASKYRNSDVVNRLTEFQKKQIHEGFELSYSHGSLYVPVDLIKLIIDFCV